MYKYLFFVAILSLSLVSCGGEGTTNTSNDTKNTTTKNKVEQIVKPKESYLKDQASLRSQALSILNHRIKTDPKIYALMEVGILEYEFVFNGKEMSKAGAMNGSWIDMMDGHVYKYGKYDEVHGTGKYHYQFDEAILLLIDDDESSLPQEWQVKSAGDALVLIGTQLYGNNAYQMKLRMQNEIPVKTAK